MNSAKREFKTVLSRSAAMKEQVASLFQSGGTFGPGTIRYDKGKYNVCLTGRELGFSFDRPIWCEKRKDNDGPYWALFTFRK